MRGPSYTEEEKNAMQQVAKDKSLTHAQRVEKFFTLVTSDRTPDAVGQKIRKYVAEAAGKKAPKAAVAKPVTSTRPVVPPAAAAAAAPNGNGNGHKNGNGHAVTAAPAAEISVKYGALELKGSAKDVGQALVQLSA